MIPQLSNEKLNVWLSKPDHIILDVRTPVEWQQLGMIPGATGIPIQALMERAAELPKDAYIAVICEHGVRSMAAAEWLLHEGYTHVANHTYGMSAWDGERTFPSSIS